MGNQLEGEWNMTVPTPDKEVKGPKEPKKTPYQVLTTLIYPEWDKLIEKESGENLHKMMKLLDLLKGLPEHEQAHIVKMLMAGDTEVLELKTNPVGLYDKVTGAVAQKQKLSWDTQAKAYITPPPFHVPLQFKGIELAPFIQKLPMQIPPKPPMLDGVTDEEWEFAYVNFMKTKDAPSLGGVPLTVSPLVKPDTLYWLSQQGPMKSIITSPQVYEEYKKLLAIGPQAPKVYHKSEKDDWGTPWPLFQLLSKAFGPFDLDPCADAWNCKVPMYFDMDEDGLKQQWYGKVFVNPPYSKVGEWVAKAASEMPNCETITLLVASRTDTNWWFQLWGAAARIWFLKGRVTFEGAPSPAPFPSAVVQLGPKLKKNIAVWDWKTSLKEQEIACGKDSESGSSVPSLKP